MLFRIVSALKVSSKDKSGYDPMKMLKQNTKKIYTKEDIEALVNSKKDDNKIVEDNTDSDKQKQTYHSSDDSDGDETNCTDSMKKKRKDTKYSDTEKKSVSGAKSTCDVEQVCDDKNQTKRQTILLSATLTQAVEKLAGLTMQDPIFVDAAKENVEVSGGDVSEINEDLVVPQSVTQSYIVTPPKLRMVTLSAYIARICQVRNISVSIGKMM